VDQTQHEARLLQVLSHKPPSERRSSLPQHLSPRLGVSGTIDPHTGELNTVSVRSYKSEPVAAKVTRSVVRLVSSQNSRDYTLIAYSPDCLGLSPKRLFRVPNLAIDPYMRRCLMSANASSNREMLTKMCQCKRQTGQVCHDHPLPDTNAKYVAVFVIDPMAPISSQEHRKLIAEHYKNPKALDRGAWAEYEIPAETTDFSTTPITHSYILHLFI
jgi:hypothetical protein